MMKPTYYACRLGRRPAKQGPRSVLQSQDTDEKCATGDKTCLNLKEVKYIGTWNVRTLYKTGQLDILLHQLSSYKWSIVGLSEIRWTGNGELTKDDCKIIYSGRKDDVHQEGVAILCSKEASRALMGYKPISSRIVKARFQLQHTNLTVFQVYAPTANARDEDIDEFYADLQQEIDEVPSQDMMMILGDWNAKVGKNWRAWHGALGKFGYGEENERGEKLLNFCLNNNLVIANTMTYKRKAKHQWTWESPDGVTKNQIDYVLVNKKWRTSITSCRAFPGADIGSDHQLLLAGARIKLKRQRLQKKVKRFNISKLKDNLIKD